MIGRAAAVVLVGGASSRMGADKATLAWKGGTLLTRAIAALSPAVDRVVVARAPGQALPALSPEVLVVEDARPGRGPLEGMRAGLRALDPEEVAFVAAVDLPGLSAPFASAVLAALPADRDAAVPWLGGRPQPLAGAYRAAAAAAVAAALEVGELRVGGLLGRLRVARLDAARLPGGADALRNINTPAELAYARRAQRLRA